MKQWTDSKLQVNKKTSEWKSYKLERSHKVTSFKIHPQSQKLTKVQQNDPYLTVTANKTLNFGTPN